MEKMKYLMEKTCSNKFEEVFDEDAYLMEKFAYTARVANSLANRWGISASAARRNAVRENQIAVRNSSRAQRAASPNNVGAGEVEAVATSPEALSWKEGLYGALGEGVNKAYIWGRDFVNSVKTRLGGLFSRSGAKSVADEAAGGAAKRLPLAVRLPLNVAKVGLKAAVPAGALYGAYRLGQYSVGDSTEAKSGGTPAAVTVDDRSISDHQRSQGVGVFEGSGGFQDGAGSFVQPQPQPWTQRPGVAPYIAPRPQANVQFRGYDWDTGKYDGWKIPDYVSQDLWPDRPANMNRGGRFYSHDNSVNELRRRMAKGEKVPMRLKAELMDNPHIGTDAEGG